MSAHAVCGCCFDVRTVPLQSTPALPKCVDMTLFSIRPISRPKARTDGHTLGVDGTQVGVLQQVHDEIL